MPISAAGSEVRQTKGCWIRGRRLQGFTLLELMVVAAIVAMATLGVALSLGDSARNQLDTEAQRLAALLESGRAQSRTLGVPVRWMPRGAGFVFEGLQAGKAKQQADAPPDQWQFEGIAASVAAPILLGPEPLIPPQSVRLWKTNQPGRVLVVATDGLRPFAVRAAAAP